MTSDALPTLVFATHNPNKVRELQEMLGDRYRLRSLTDIGCHEDIVEKLVSAQNTYLQKYYKTFKTYVCKNVFVKHFCHFANNPLQDPNPDL